LEDVLRVQIPIWDLTVGGDGVLGDENVGLIPGGPVGDDAVTELKETELADLV